MTIQLDPDLVNVEKHPLLVALLEPNRSILRTRLQSHPLSPPSPRSDLSKRAWDRILTEWKISLHRLDKDPVPSGYEDRPEYQQALTVLRICSAVTQCITGPPLPTYLHTGSVSVPPERKVYQREKQILFGCSTPGFRNWYLTQVVHSIEEFENNLERQLSSLISSP